MGRYVQDIKRKKHSDEETTQRLVERYEDGSD